ncbi:MAG TPA: hypothetical protein VFQ50_03835 [Flavobacterium sp.]|jgi:hypothetical protein|nr:hypothetical protein [Flavobacterium sp.]
MKKAALLFIVLISTCCYSQKVSLKKGEILIDEIAWMKYTECGAFDSTCSVINMNGDEVIFMKLIKIPGAEPITNYNRDGSLTFKEVKFLGFNTMVEFEGTTDKKILALIYNAKLIDEKGELDDEKVQRFVEKHGTPVSDRRGNTSTNTNTIIIKESPEPRRGVNINIGR